MARASDEERRPNELRDRAAELAIPSAQIPPDTDVACDPLPDDWNALAEQLADSFASVREPSNGERAVLVNFAHLCLRFAHMEQRVQGEILCEIPAHIPVITGRRAASLVEEAEQLAKAERANLGIPSGPVEDLAQLLDERGIKVISRPHANRSHTGAFLFDEHTGPALLSLAATESPAGRFVVAHEYCHLLADIDPYENRLCLHSVGTDPHPAAGGALIEDEALLAEAETDALALAEIRADLFARAFLLPGAHFLDTLRMFQIAPRRDLSLARLADVACYYGVDAATALKRLVDLRVLSASTVLPMLAALPSSEAGTEPAGPGVDSVPTNSIGTLYPEPAARFVNLSLALYLKHQTSLDQTATLLGIDRDAVEQLLSWSEPRPTRQSGTRECPPAGRAPGDHQPR